MQELLSFPEGRTLQGITFSLFIYCLRMYFEHLFPRNSLLLEREGEIHSVFVMSDLFLNLTVFIQLDLGYRCVASI